MVDIKPNRHNWKLFCQEPELSADERKRWREMADQIREAESEGNGELFDFIADATQKEHQAAKAAERLEGWAGLVQSADARRKLQRAELIAYATYNEKGD